MDQPDSKSPEVLVRTPDGGRQFNLRTLFEITTGVCILTPAFQYAQRDSNRDTLALTLLLFACGLSMLGACWLFVRRCPMSRAGSLLAILFCMSTFNGFLLGGFALFHEVDQAAPTGVTLARFALMWIVGSLVSFLYTCMISLALLIPATLAELAMRARWPAASPPIAGILIGALTAVVVALAWVVGSPATAQWGPILHMLLATVYGGYVGGRLIERRLAKVTMKATATRLN